MKALASASPSRVATWHVLLLFGPLVMVLSLLRLLQYSLLLGPHARSLDLLPLSAQLTSNAPLPLLLLTVSVVGAILVRRRWPGLPLAAWMALSLLGAALLFTLAAWVAPWWIAEWVSLSAFDYMRWDLAGLVTLAGLAWLGLAHARRPATRAATVVTLHGLCLVLLLLSFIEFGYLVSTGSPGDWQLIGYFLAHLDELMPLLSSEASSGKALLLVLPVVLVLAPLAVLRGRAFRLPGRHRGARRAPALAAVLVPTLVFIFALPRPEAAWTFQPNSLFTLARDLGAQAFSGNHVMAAPAVEPAQEYDVAGLRLAATDSTRRLNVVVFLLESARAQATTPYNPSLPTTPFLDSLARQSLFVEQMFSVVAHTNKTLAPLFAGIPPYLRREMEEARPEGLPAPGLPALLAPFGYRSGFFTAATNRYERRDLVMKNLGFETVVGDGGFSAEGYYRKQYYGVEDRAVLPLVEAWLDERQARREPFVAAFLTLVGHHPYDLPPDFPRLRLDPDNEERDNYLNSLRYADAYLREVFQAFERRGLLDSTLFIVTGDHGQAFGEHGQYAHNIVYDEALQVPALVYHPARFPAGSRATGRRQHIDLLPTIFEALGLAVVGGTLPGEPLQGPGDPHRTLYHSNWNGDVALAMRQDSLKYIYYYKRQPMEVYDLEDDPLERHNLADRLPPAQLRRAELDLLLWRSSVERLYAGPPVQAQ